MGLTARLHNVAHSVYQGVGNAAHNVSQIVSTTAHDIAHNVKTTTGKIKDHVVHALTISEANRAKIAHGAKKIINFILKNKSLIFFGLTVGFSYYMAPLAAFEYLAKFGLSFSSTFVSGMLLGAGVLALKNIFISYPTRKTQETKNKMTQDDKINYLLGISNLCLNYLYPTTAFISSVAFSGFMLVKSGYKFLTPPDEVKKDHKVTFLVPKELEENSVTSASVAQAVTNS